MKRAVYILILMVMSGAGAAADDYISLNEKGNKAFSEKNYEKALEYYHEAEVEKPETPKIQYNHANTLLETGRFEEAVEKYNNALNTDDVSLKSRIYYNTGNGYFSHQDYQKAIEAYQTTLDLNPDDLDAKHNLELARVRLEEQKQEQQQQDQQQQQQQDQQGSQDQQDQQQEQQQQQEDQQQPEEKQQQQQQQQQKQDEQENKDEEQQPQPQEPQQDKMSKEDAERILNSLADQEKADQQKKKVKISGSYRGSDW